MKRVQLIVAAATLAFILTIAVSAQTRSPTPTPAPPRPTAAATAPAVNLPATKIAYVNTDAFRVENGGIVRYVNAMKLLAREFEGRERELKDMQTRVNAIADEISRLSSGVSVDQRLLRTKQEEGERLQTEMKRKKEDADKAFQKRYDEVVGPVSQAIGRGLDQFALERGITMIFDITKLAPAILSVNPAMDVTQSFIAEYNRKNPATASAPPR